MVLLMRDLPLQSYFVRLRHQARPSGGTIKLGDTRLGGPGNLAIDVRTSDRVEPEIWGL